MAYASFLSFSYQAITSVTALIRLLKSESLVMYHENTTFTLVRFWLYSRQGWTPEDKQEAFDTILDSNALQFHHMDFDYMTVYACRTPWMQGSNMTLDIVQQAMLIKNGYERQQAAKELSSNRNKNEMCYQQLEAKVSKDVCISLGKKRRKIICFLGLARGLPIYLQIERSGTHGTNTLGMYIGWSSGSPQFSGRHSRGMVPSMKMGFDFKATPGLKSSTISERSFKEGTGWGWSSFAPWEEISAPTSSRFVDGIMNVHVKIDTPPS